MKDKKSIWRIVLDYLMMSLGGIVFCLAWEAFLIPNGIASGGLTGLCTIIQFATGFPVAISYIILNVFLLGVAFLVLGKGFGFKTIYCILFTTLMFEILPHVEIIKSLPGHPLYISEKVLIPIIGGLIEAVGVGWIMLRGGSTGGTDVIALILNKFWPVSPGRVYMITDLFIIASILLIPGKNLEDMIYGYLAMLSFSFFLDFLLLGSKATIQVMVFSQRYQEIADYITHTMHRGVTALDSLGWYSQAEGKVLLIVVRKSQMTELTRAIKEIDSKAFVSISSATGVYGEGFEEMKAGFQRKKNNLPQA